MSAAKHTPGPWTVETVQTQVGYCHKVHPIRACIYVDGLARVPQPEPDANARLISAAPDLLQAAKDIVRVLETEGMGGNCAELNAAIAKAEGRS